MSRPQGARLQGLLARTFYVLRSRQPGRQAGGRIAVLLLAGTLLVGCADGRAPEAERGREADERRDSVVTDLQATQTWSLVHGTPESTPTAEE